MAEHDDALLDEDIASLPNISDEEYEDDHYSDEDFSNLDHPNNESKFSIKVENEHDTLNLEVNDELKGSDKVRDDELNRSLKNNTDLIYDKQIFDENNEDSKSLIYQKHSQIQSSDSDTTLSKHDLRLKLYNLYKQKIVNNMEDTNDEAKPTIIKNQNYNNAMPYLNTSESMRRTSDLYESDRCSFMENRSLINLKNFSHSEIMNQSYNNLPTENFNTHIMPFPNSIPKSFVNEPLHRCLPHQSQFLYNQNMCGNYTMMHPQMQLPSFIMNQNFSVNPIFPVHQILPMNKALPFRSNEGRGMSNLNINQNMPMYPQPMYSSQHDGHPNLSTYAENPLNFNGYKILVNRDFRKNQPGREVTILHNDMEYNEFLKIKSSFPYDSKNFESNHLKNYDVYSYFSDVWQEKRMEKNNSKSFVPEIIFSKNINDLNKSRNKLRKKNNKKDLKMYSVGKDEVLLRKKNVLFSVKNNDENFRNTKIVRGLNKKEIKKIVENQTVDKNNNIDKMNNFKKQKNAIDNIVKTRNIDTNLKKKAELDPQMMEYCRKVEEQKVLREKFLLEKENRRKLLAMEKLGIKNEPFIDTFDLEIQEIINIETNYKQSINGTTEDSCVIEIND